MHNGEASLQQSDTSRAARERQVELFRAMGPLQRFEMAISMSESTRELSLMGLQKLYPEESDWQLRLRLAANLYGDAARDRLVAARARRQR